MFQLLKSLAKGYESYMIHVGRNRARSVLMMQDRRALEDMGISYHLLLKGTSAWPWRDDVVQATALNTTTKPNRRQEKRAIRELRSMSNAELRDMGISRGGIVDAVRHGRRDDIEVPTRLRKDLAKSAA